MTPRPTPLGWALITSTGAAATTAALALTAHTSQAETPTNLLLWATVLASIATLLLATLTAAALQDHATTPQAPRSAPLADPGPHPKPRAWVVRHALPVASHELGTGS